MNKTFTNMTSHAKQGRDEINDEGLLAKGDCFWGELTLQEDSEHEYDVDDDDDVRRPHSFKDLGRLRAEIIGIDGDEELAGISSSHSMKSSKRSSRRRRSLPQVEKLQSPSKRGSKKKERSGHNKNKSLPSSPGERSATANNHTNTTPTTNSFQSPFQSPRGVSEGAALMMNVPEYPLLVSPKKQRSLRNILGGTPSKPRSRRQSCNYISDPAGTAEENDRKKDSEIERESMKKGVQSKHEEGENGATATESTGVAPTKPKSRRNLFSRSASAAAVVMTGGDGTKKNIVEIKKQSSKSRGRVKESSKHSNRDDEEEEKEGEGSTPTAEEKSERRSRSPISRMIAYKKKIFKTARTKWEGKNSNQKCQKGDQTHQPPRVQEDEDVEVEVEVVEDKDQVIKNLKAENKKLRKETNQLRKEIAEQSLDMATTTQHFAASSSHHRPKTELHLECYEKVNEAKDQRIADLKKRICYLEFVCLENGIEINDVVDTTTHHHHSRRRRGLPMQETTAAEGNNVSSSSASACHTFATSSWTKIPSKSNIMRTNNTATTATGATAATSHDRSSSTHHSFFGESYHQSLHPQEVPDDNDNDKINNNNKSNSSLESSLSKLPGSGVHTCKSIDIQSGVISEAVVSLDLDDVIAASFSPVRKQDSGDDADDDDKKNKDSWLSLSADLASYSKMRESSKSYNEETGWKEYENNDMDEGGDDEYGIWENSLSLLQDDDTSSCKVDDTDNGEIWEESLNDGSDNPTKSANSNEEKEDCDKDVCDSNLEVALSKLPGQKYTGKEVPNSDKGGAMNESVSGSAVMSLDLEDVSPRPAAPRSKEERMKDSWLSLSANLSIDLADDEQNKDQEPPNVRPKMVDATGRISRLSNRMLVPPGGRSTVLRKKRGRRAGKRIDTVSSSARRSRDAATTTTHTCSSTSRNSMVDLPPGGIHNGSGGGGIARHLFGGRKSDMTTVTTTADVNRQEVATVLDSLDRALGEKMDFNAPDMPFGVRSKRRSM